MVARRRATACVRVAGRRTRPGRACRADGAELASRQGCRSPAFAGRIRRWSRSMRRSCIARRAGWRTTTRASATRDALGRRQALAHPAAASCSPMARRSTSRCGRADWPGWNLAFWLLSGLGLLLYLTVVVLVLSRWSALNGLFALMSLCQLANLGLAAIASAYGFGLPGVLWSVDVPLRMALDLVTAAAAVHAASLLYPPAIPGLARFELPSLRGPPRCCSSDWRCRRRAAARVVVGAGRRRRPRRPRARAAAPHRPGEPHVQAAHVRRIGSVGLVTWLLMTFAVAAAQRLPANLQPAVEVVSTTWYVFLTALLLLVPLFTRSRQAVREFALAAVCTIAVRSTCSSWPCSPRSVRGADAVAVRRPGRVRGLAPVDPEPADREHAPDDGRMFDQLYRIAREVGPTRAGSRPCCSSSCATSSSRSVPSPSRASAPARSRIEENERPSSSRSHR